MSCGALHNNLAVARDRKKIPGKSGQKIGPPEAMGLRIVWNGPIINEPCPERSCRGRTLWSVPPSDLLRALIWCRTRRRATRWALDLIMITRRPVPYSTASRWLVLDVRWSWFSVFCLFAPFYSSLSTCAAKRAVGAFVRCSAVVPTLSPSAGTLTPAPSATSSLSRYQPLVSSSMIGRCVATVVEWYHDQWHYI